MIERGTGSGTVYKVTPSGTETVVYAFTGGADGGYPFEGWSSTRKAISMAPLNTEAPVRIAGAAAAARSLR